MLRTLRGRWVATSAGLQALLGAVVIIASACREAGTPVGPDTLPPDTVVDLAALPTEVIPDRYIVVFKSGVQDPPGLARQLVSQHRGRLRHAYGAALKGFAADLSDDAVEALEKNPNVA